MESRESEALIEVVPSIERWEEAFADGLVATSREQAAEPWLLGHVHVARDLPEQKEPVLTGLMDVHHVILFDAPSAIREVVPGRPPLIDGPVQPGELFIYPREITTEENWTSWSEGLSFTSVILSPATLAAACRALDRDYASLEFDERYGERDAFVEHLARRLIHELNAGGPGGRLYAEQLLQTLAVHLTSHYTAEEPRLRPVSGGLPPARLKRVQAYIEAHLAEEITLERLAEEAHLSPYHFARLFKESVGVAPNRYVMGRRVARARQLLQETEWTVSRVAAEVG